MKTKKKLKVKRKPKYTSDKINESVKRRVQPVFNDGQHMLLYYIIEKHGGGSAVAAKLGCEPHIIFNWRRRGSIPLRFVKLVATALKETPWGLNYEEVTFFENTYPAWRKVVENYNLPKNITESILYQKPPKEIVGF